MYILRHLCLIQGDAIILTEKQQVNQMDEKFTGSLLRSEIPEVPMDAIREALLDLKISRNVLYGGIPKLRGTCITQRILKALELD